MSSSIHLLSIYDIRHAILFPVPALVWLRTKPGALCRDLTFTLRLRHETGCALMFDLDSRLDTKMERLTKMGKLNDKSCVPAVWRPRDHTR